MICVSLLTGIMPQVWTPRWFKKDVCEETGEEYWRFTGDYWGLREKVGKGEGKWEGVEDIF